MINSNWAYRKYSYGAGELLLPIAYPEKKDGSRIWAVLLGMIVFFAACLWTFHSLPTLQPEKIAAVVSSPVRLKILPKPPEVSVVQVPAGKSDQPVVEAPHKVEKVHSETTPVQPKKQKIKKEKITPANKGERNVKPEVKTAEKMKQEKTEIQSSPVPKKRAPGKENKGNVKGLPEVAASGLPDMDLDDDSGPDTGRLQSMHVLQRSVDSGDNERADITSGNSNLAKEAPRTGSLAAGLVPSIFYSPSSEESTISRRADGEDENSPALRRTMSSRQLGMQRPARSSRDAAVNIGQSRVGAPDETGPVNGYRRMGVASSGGGSRPASVRGLSPDDEVSGIGVAKVGPGDGSPFNRSPLSRSVVRGSGNSGNARGREIGFSGQKADSSPSRISAVTERGGIISYEELAICEDVNREKMLMDEIFNVLYEHPDISGFKTSAGIVGFYKTEDRSRISVKLKHSTGKRKFVTRCELLEFALNLLKKGIRGR